MILQQQQRCHKGDATHQANLLVVDLQLANDSCPLSIAQRFSFLFHHGSLINSCGCGMLGSDEELLAEKKNYGHLIQNGDSALLVPCFLLDIRIFVFASGFFIFSVKNIFVVVAKFRRPVSLSFVQNANKNDDSSAIFGWIFCVFHLLLCADRKPNRQQTLREHNRCRARSALAMEGPRLHFFEKRRNLFGGKCWNYLENCVCRVQLMEMMQKNRKKSTICILRKELVGYSKILRKLQKKCA